LSIPLYVLSVVIGTKNTRLTGTSDGIVPLCAPGQFIFNPQIQSFGHAGRSFVSSALFAYLVKNRLSVNRIVEAEEIPNPFGDLPV
jgi:hypothetical protein